MSTQIVICILIFLAALFMFATRIYSMGATSIIVMTLFVITGCLPAADAIALFGNSNVVIMVGMSVVGAAFLRTQFVNQCVDVLVKVTGGNFKIASLGFILLGAFLVNCGIDPTVLFLMLYPLLLKLCERCGVNRSKAMGPFLIGIVGCMTTLPTAGGVSMAARLNGFVEAYGFTQQLEVMDLFWSKIPLFVLTIIYAWAIAPKLAPAQPVVELKDQESAAKNDREPLPPFKEFMGVAIFFGTMVLMILSGTIGVPAYVISLAAGTSVAVFGILNQREITSAIPISLILLFAGASSIGLALQHTGAGELIGNILAGFLGGTHNSYIIGAVFFLIPFILTQFMMNSTALNVMLPICLLTCSALGANPVGPLLLLNTACGSGYLLPTGMAATAACADVGGYDAKTMLKMGGPLGIVTVVIGVVWTMTLYPCF